MAEPDVVPLRIAAEPPDVTGTELPTLPTDQSVPAGQRFSTQLVDDAQRYFSRKYDRVIERAEAVEFLNRLLRFGQIISHWKT